MASSTWVSAIHPNEPVIGDDNYEQFIPSEIKIFQPSDVDEAVDEHQPHGRGYIPRDYSAEPFGSLPYAQPLDIPTIDRDEWPALIEYMEKTKSRLSDIRRRGKYGTRMPSCDQNGTNYCWIHGVTSAMYLVRAIQSQPYVRLSPASVGSKVTGFRNVGGWGTKGLKYVIEHGMVPEELWPANKISRQYDTEEAWTEAKKYRVTEWYDVPSGSFDKLMTCLFYRLPVAIGLSWWGHLICAMDPVLLSRAPFRFGCRIWNSWGDGWGEAGESVLTESRSIPNDACAPRVLIAA